MDSEKIEKTIMINNKEFIVKIDKTIDEKKSKKIIDDFCTYFKQMKSGLKKIETFKPSDFDYIVIMLVLKHCTDFLKEPMPSFVNLTLTYSSLVTKNILQQIMKAASEDEFAKSVDKIMISCRVMIQNEMSITKLENILPTLTDGIESVKIINFNKLKEYNDKINKAKKQKENEKQQKEINSIDSLLDQYNDMKLLFDMFGDEEYGKKMKMIMSKVKRKWNKVYGNEKDPE